MIRGYKLAKSLKDLLRGLEKAIIRAHVKSGENDKAKTTPTKDKRNLPNGGLGRGLLGTC